MSELDNNGALPEPTLRPRIERRHAGERRLLPTADPAELQAEPERVQGGLVWRLTGALKTMRPHQWVKNVFVLAPIFFAKDIFKEEMLLQAFGAFAVFCLLASAVYTMNDLVDVEADRQHPVKRFRPIPSGRVPLSLARALTLLLVTISLIGAMLLPLGFIAAAMTYFVLNIAYSFKLKHVAYIDVSVIAAGFVLRVVAGGFATGIHLSWYLLACTALLALFLGFGKRRHELAQTAQKGGKTRAVLQAYSPRALTIALALTGTATIATYIAYTVDPHTREFFKSDWLWLTAPNTLFGVLRFVQLVVGSPKAESPTQEMLRDKLFLANIVVWVIVVFVIVYRLRVAVSP